MSTFEKWLWWLEGSEPAQQHQISWLLFVKCIYECVFSASWAPSTGMIGIVIPGQGGRSETDGFGPALCKKKKDSAASLALQPLMEGLITGCVHRPYHACPLSAPHWIIPGGGICTPSIIYSITRTHLCFSFSVSHEKAGKKARWREL